MTSTTHPTPGSTRTEGLVLAAVLVVSILSSGLLLTGSALGWSVSVGGLEHPAIVVSAAVAIPAVALGLVVYNRR